MSDAHDLHSTVPGLEDHLERFDAAWRHQNCPALALFLPPADDPARREVLHELIKIDLEYRWRAARRMVAEGGTSSLEPRPIGAELPRCPRLEDYVACFPELGREEALPLDLIGEEYRVRHCWGDRPDAAEYMARFGTHGAPLRHLLADIDAELAAEPARTVGRAGAPSPARAAATPPLTQVGRYELKELLGRGAFGSVWRGWDAELRRAVAVKLPWAGRFAGPAQEAWFLREARSVAPLQHPGIVAVHDVGRDRDTVYIVSELVPGISLQQWLTQQRPSFAAAAELVAHLADALDYAHRQGIVHRDLKPGNILLAFSREPRASAESALARGSRLNEGVAKIADFGLAKCLAGEAAAVEDDQVVGTPAYMSPEQVCRPAAVDGRSDVYSLGVILYELLTGRVPFAAPTTAALTRQVVSDAPPAPRQWNDRVPHDLETITLKCLGKEPEQRYDTAAALAADLRHWLAGEPIQARAVGRLERLVLWCRRSPVRAALVAALLLAVVAAGLLAIRTFQQGRQVEHYAQRLEAIDALRGTLQDKLDEERRRGAQLVRRVLHATERTATLAPQHPEVQKLTNQLRDLVTRFEAEVGAARLSADDRLRLRLAQATVATAEQHYDRALALVTEADAEGEQARTEAQIEREIKVLQVRGHAFYGLRQWEQALACYRRILQRQPDHLASRTGAANCLHSLGRPREALAEYQALVETYARLVEREGRKELAEVFAGSLNNRGNARAAQRQYVEALADLNKAVSLYTRLVEQGQRPDLAKHLAGTLANRGRVHALRQHFPEAIADMQQSVEILTRLVEREGRRELADMLAGSLNNRGNILRARNQLSAALADYDAAIRLCTRLIEQEGRPELANNLAISLDNRATVLQKQGKLPEAVANRDQAVAILTRLVEQEGRPELADELARILHNRGLARYDLRQVNQALPDLEEALTIYTRLVEREGRKDLAGPLAESRTDRDKARMALRAVDDLAFALQQPLERAVELLVFRCGVLAGRGEYAAATATADKLRGFSLQNPAQLYDAACAYALCVGPAAAGQTGRSAEDQARCRRCAEQALRLLREALRQGFRDFEALQNDADLAALRPSAEFQKLLAELDGSASKKATK